MILSDKTIEKYIDSGKIKITPEFNKNDIRLAGVRLHLDENILLPIKNQTVDLENPRDIKFKKIKIDKKGYILKPNDFILASTNEKIKVPANILCRLDGRSTIARLGLIIHCTSNIIDGNHNESRSIVLEIKNLGVFNVILRKKMPLGMLTFNQLTTPVKQKSQSQYKNQTSVKAPNIKYKTGVDK